MLAIKLQRLGKKHQPSYRVVVAEKRSKMAAPPVEDLGTYNPFTKALVLKKERVLYWLGIGAQPTVTAHNFLVKEGIITKPKLQVKMKKPTVAENKKLLYIGLGLGIAAAVIYMIVEIIAIVASRNGS